MWHRLTWHLGSDVFPSIANELSSTTTDTAHRVPNRAYHGLKRCALLCAPWRPTPMSRIPSWEACDIPPLSTPPTHLSSSLPSSGLFPKHMSQLNLLSTYSILLSACLPPIQCNLLDCFPVCVLNKYLEKNEWIVPHCLEHSRMHEGIHEFTHFKSFNPMWWALLVPFARQENWDTKRFSSLFRVVRVVNSGERMQTVLSSVKAPITMLDQTGLFNVEFGNRSIENVYGCICVHIITACKH